MGLRMSCVKWRGLTGQSILTKAYFFYALRRLIFLMDGPLVSQSQAQASKILLTLDIKNFSQISLR
jgi:hypothetical protein